MSHATARELGYDTSAEADRPFVEVSGRKGTGVKADDMLDRLTGKASGEVSRRNPDMPADEVRATAERIAVAALRYFMVKFSRAKVIAFDMDEALSFEGESGPYLQYATVRAANIFGKLRDREGLDEAAHRGLPGDGARRRTSSRATRATTCGVSCWRRAGWTRWPSRRSARWSPRCWRSTRSDSRRHSTRRTSATRFSTRRTRTRSAWRAAVAAYVRLQMTRALDLMGCDVPVRM